MDKIRIGIISAGGAGRAHISRFIKNPRAEVTAVYDPKAPALEETRNQMVKKFGEKRVGFITTTNITDFFNRKDIDAVSVCSPDHMHRIHVCSALNKGLHVLCEKPMATTGRDADEMISAALKADRKLMVHHQMRYLPVFDKAKVLVETGKIGDVFAIEADYCHDMRERATLYDDWRVKKDSYQEIVLGGGCHPLDLMQWIAEDRIVEVFSYANHMAFPAFPDVDTAIAVLKFRSGRIGRMTITFGSTYPGTRHSLTVFGSAGTLIDGLHLRKNKKSEMSSFPSQYLSPLKTSLGKILLRLGGVIHFPYDHNEHDLASELLINEFLQSILTDSTPPISSEESADAVRVCEAVIKSYRTGKPAAVER